MGGIEEFSGDKPPVSKFNISLSDAAICLIGRIIVQWGALMTEIDEVQLGLKLLINPRIPRKLGKKKPPVVASKLKTLREAGAIIYENERPTAVEEFFALLDRIEKVQPHKDALAHGTFALMDNKDPNLVVVYYRGKKREFSTPMLVSVANEISEITGTLKGFDSWVHYAENIAMFRKLEERNSRPG
jgi:hypothetical protein